MRKLKTNEMLMCVTKSAIKGLRRYSRDQTFQTDGHLRLVAMLNSKSDCDL